MKFRRPIPCWAHDKELKDPCFSQLGLGLGLTTAEASVSSTAASASLTLNEALNAAFYSLRRCKGEERDQQWQERETFNERSGCWLTPSKQSQQKCNFNRN